MYQLVTIMQVGHSSADLLCVCDWSKLKEISNRLCHEQTYNVWQNYISDISPTNYSILRQLQQTNSLTTELNTITPSSALGCATCFIIFEAMWGSFDIICHSYCIRYKIATDITTDLGGN